MKKIFAFDLDGTLLTKQNYVHPETIEALKLVKEQGHYNVVATGRGLSNIMPLFKNNDLSPIDFLICSNGAMIHDPKTGKNEIIQSIKPEVMEIIYNIFIETKSILLRVDTIDKNQTLIHDEYMSEWATKTHVQSDTYYAPSTKQEVWDNIYKPGTIITQIALRNDIHKAADVTNQLTAALKESGCEVYLTNSIYSDINGINVSKWNTLKYLANSLNVDIQNIVAFGDSGNDVSMIQNVGYGLAMGNATLDAKAVAKEVIGDHNTGAIGQFIKKYLQKDL